MTSGRPGSQGICGEPECTAKARSQHLCSMHYMRQYRAELPGGSPYVTGDERDDRALDDAATKCGQLGNAVLSALRLGGAVPSRSFDSVVRLQAPTATKVEITAALAGIGISRKPHGDKRGMHVVCPVQLPDDALLQVSLGAANAWGSRLEKKLGGMGTQDWVDELQDWVPDYI